MSKVFTLRKGAQVIYVADKLKNAKAARPGLWDEISWGAWAQGDYTITHEDWTKARESLSGRSPSPSPTEPQKSAQEAVRGREEGF